MNFSPDTITTALQIASQKWPEKPALCAREIQLNWRELYNKVEHLARYWSAMGVLPNSTIACFTDKKPEVVLTFLTCCRIGAIYCPINFKLKPKHIRDQLKTANVSVVITQRDRRSVLDKTLSVLTKPVLIFSIDGEHAWRQSAVLPFDTVKSFSPVEHQPEPNDVCYLNYTSGSTGRPKGAVTTHHQIISNAQMTIDALDFKSDDVFLGMFSVFMHPHELFHRSLLVGGAFVIVDSLSPRIIAEQIEFWGVTWMMAVPSFYQMMTRYKATAKRCPDLSSLRFLESGGAYVSAEVVQQMEAQFEAQFVPVWGCTEATGVVLANLSHRSTGATGTVIHGYQAKLVDEKGRVVSSGDVGELWISGPAIVSFYMGQPEESKASFEDGWYKTGDLMYEQSEGLFRFVSRRSEMMKVGGIRVFPLEIEQAVMTHPSVVACVVVRAFETLRGEVPHAIVQLKEEHALSERDLNHYCNARLARYKVPRKISFWPSIPMLPNGKVDKRRLREMLG